MLSDTGEAAIDRLREVADGASADGFTVRVAGQPLLFLDFSRIAEEDLRRGETFGLGIALAVLVTVFAAVVAAVVPIVMGLFAIAVALGVVALLGQFLEFNLFVENMVSMIGLALGIDYSLFILSRYREERRRGNDKLEAIGRAGATANRATTTKSSAGIGAPRAVSRTPVRGPWRQTTNDERAKILPRCLGR